MEDIQVPTSIPEYSQDAPFEKPQLQFIDIIDPIANAVEIFPYENADPNPDSSFTHGNQGANHWIENTAHEMSGEEKEDQGKISFCNFFLPSWLGNKIRPLVFHEVL